VVLNHVDASHDPAFGYNAARNVYGDLMKAGVIDPVKVTRLALQNAASIASLVLMTDCVIVSKPQPPMPAHSSELGMTAL
jgi:chaperonin GroEL